MSLLLLDSFSFYVIYSQIINILILFITLLERTNKFALDTPWHGRAIEPWWWGLCFVRAYERRQQVLRFRDRALSCCVPCLPAAVQCAVWPYSVYSQRAVIWLIWHASSCETRGSVGPAGNSENSLVNSPLSQPHLFQKKIW
jgi:hypothetical protein